MLQDHGLFRIQGSTAKSLSVLSAPSVPPREKIRFSQGATAALPHPTDALLMGGFPVYTNRIAG